MSRAGISRPRGRHGWVLCVLLLGCMSPRAAAQAISFGRDIEAAVARARREQRPLMFYVLDYSRRDGRERRRRNAAVFRDAGVVRAAAPFIPVEIAIDQHPDLRERWGLGPRSELLAVFTTPDGDVLGKSHIGNPENLARDLHRALEAFAQREWTDVLRPILEDEHATPKQLADALKRIRALKIREADYDVAVLLDRPSARETLRGDVLRTLGALSTRTAVRRLIPLAESDSAAAAALKQCTPSGAVIMAEWLGSGSRALDAVLYDAIARITHMSRPKPERFWLSSDEDARRAEIHRAREAARQAMMRASEHASGG